jgi:hypothetical protein
VPAQEIFVDCEHLLSVTDQDSNSLAAMFHGRLLVDANRPTTEGRRVGALAGGCVLVRYNFSDVWQLLRRLRSLESLLK